MSGGGIRTRALAPLSSERSDDVLTWVGIPFEVAFATVTTGDTTYAWVNHEYNGFVITQAYGIMLANGGVGDTAVVQTIIGGTTSNATDVADLSVFVQNDQFDFAQIMLGSGLTATARIVNPGDTIQVVTASDPQCVIFVRGFWFDV